MNPNKKIIVSISLDPILIKKIDDERGLIPRSAFIENELKQGLEFSQAKEKILNLCVELENITQVRGRYPLKSPLMSPAVQMMMRDIRERIEKMKFILTT